MKPLEQLPASVVSVGRQVAEKHHVELEQLVSSDRHETLARARAEWIRLAVQTWGLSSWEGGKLFGMHPGTIRHHMLKAAEHG